MRKICLLFFAMAMVCMSCSKDSAIQPSKVKPATTKSNGPGDPPPPLPPPPPGDGDGPGGDIGPARPF